MPSANSSGDSFDDSFDDSSGAEDLTREGEGWDHVAWRVERPDGTWIIKEAKGDDDESPEERAAAVRREVAVMQLVRRYVVGMAGGGIAAGGVAADARVLPGDRLTYPRVEGVALQDLLAQGAVPPADRRRLAGEIGRLIGRLAALDPGDVGEPLPVEDEGWEPWYEELPGRVAEIRPLLDPAVAAAVDRFADREPPPYPARDRLVFCHNDLGGEHVLVDPATLTVQGVIDWADAAVADPAADAGRLLRDLGADSLPAVLDGIGKVAEPRAEVEARAWCFARLLIVEDLAYAVEHRPDLVDYERTNLIQLFANLT